MLAPIQWMGGKSRLRARLYPIFDRIQRDAFVDLFGGSGAIIFGKPPERQEIYNDANRLLPLLMRCLRDPETNATIQTLCRYTPHCREFWYENRDICRAWLANDEKLIDERVKNAKLTAYPLETVVAFCFFYCQNCGFSGKFLNAYGGGVKLAGRNETDEYASHVATLPEYVARLERVQINNLDALDALDRWNKPHVLFYCDPPYDVECAKSYSDNGATVWNTDKRDAMLDRLINLQASAVVSCYDNEAYQRLEAAGYAKEQFQTVMSVNKDTNGEPRTETVYWRWSGWKNPRRLF